MFPQLAYTRNRLSPFSIPMEKGTGDEDATSHISDEQPVGSLEKFASSIRF